MQKPASLMLESGDIFHGFSFGCEAAVSGEVVFGTSMVGYLESLTDPSYEGQILVTSYPLIGNYGVPDEVSEGGISLNFESERIHVQGLVAAEYAGGCSHWSAKKSLGSWLKEQGVPGICGVDTRALTKVLREKGAMRGRIAQCDDPAFDEEFGGGQPRNLVAEASCREIIRYEAAGDEGKTVVLVDCGVKHNILRCLLRRGVNVIRVPWDYDFSSIAYDGLFLSNGPGDPDLCRATVAHIRRALSENRPVFGVCMGNQLMAKAAGAHTYKLKYGHRGHNQPVRTHGGTKCYVTSQNHGYAVDASTLPDGWRPFFTNMNDGTNEGIMHESKPFFSVQFHPEAAGGPTDTAFLFDVFADKMRAQAA